MKQLILLLPVFACIHSIAQQNNNNIGIPIPMKNGIVFYEKTIATDKSIPKDKLYTQSEKWLKSSFPGSKEKINIDKAKGTVSSTGIFKVITDKAAGHYYWIKPEIHILITDDSCTVQSYNYYEKPIMPGVTNDYSKIEYRWWDFRKGKPWNKEDEALFKGLNQNSEDIINSFSTIVGKK